MNDSACKLRPAYHPMLKRVGTGNENRRVISNDRLDLRQANRRVRPGGKEKCDDQDYYKRSPFLWRAGKQRRHKRLLLVEIVNRETVSRDVATAYPSCRTKAIVVGADLGRPVPSRSQALCSLRHEMTSGCYCEPYRPGGQRSPVTLSCRSLSRASGWAASLGVGR
jgi:hypothetical protein